MIELRKIWAYIGAIALIGITFVLMSVSVMSIWAPLPVYLVVIAWAVFPLSIVFLPTIYFIVVMTVSHSQRFPRYVLIITVIASILNAILIFVSWDYGYKWQGEFHTKIVALENLVSFLVTIGIAVCAVAMKSHQLAYVGNFMLFFLLSWCAFPYLGELP